MFIVSHSMDDVARLTDRLVVFNKGHVEFDGTPEEVFSHAEELKEIGLDVPVPTEIAMALKKRGIAVPDGIYTNEQLLSVLVKMGKEGD